MTCPRVIPLLEAGVDAVLDTVAGDCVFRSIVTDRFGIVTAEFGNATAGGDNAFLPLNNHRLKPVGAVVALGSD